MIEKRGNFVCKLQICKKKLNVSDFYQLLTENEIVFFFLETADGQILFTYQGQFGDPNRSLTMGITIDVDDYLYVAMYFGGVVLKIDSK